VIFEASRLASLTSHWLQGFNKALWWPFLSSGYDWYFEGFRITKSAFAYNIRGGAISEFAKGNDLTGGSGFLFEQKSKSEHTLTLNLFALETFS